jgi:2'-5' RNA ligase
MRLFIGVELPDDVRRAAALVSDKLRRRVDAAAPKAAIRWVPSENLHITLWFLGEVRDADLQRVRDVVETPFAVPAFTLRLGGGGAFPPSGDPRAVWLGLVEGREALTAIYAELAARLGRLGFTPEKRPYSPHLTIARVKDIHRGDGVPVRGAIAAVPDDIGSCTIRSITLFRSRTSPKGSQYEALMRVPLG